MVLEEEDITDEALLQAVHTLYQNRASFSSAMANSNQTDSIETIIHLIEEAVAHT